MTVELDTQRQIIIVDEVAVSLDVLKILVGREVDGRLHRFVRIENVVIVRSFATVEEVIAYDDEFCLKGGRG